MDRPLDRPDPVHTSVDLAARVRAAAGRRDRDSVRTALQFGLIVVALGELTFAVPDLLLGHGIGHPDHAHLVRHTGAFGIAYAIGLLWVAHRPARARAFLPYTIALAAAMAIGAFADLMVGDVPAVYETQHVLEALGMVLVWILAARPTWSRSSDARATGDSPELSADVLHLPGRGSRADATDDI